MPRSRDDNVGPGEDALMARIRAKEEEKKRKTRLLLAASSGSNNEEVVVIGGGEKGRNLTSTSSSGHHHKSRRRSGNTSGDDDNKNNGGGGDSTRDAAAVTKRSSRVLNLYEGHSKGEEEEKTSRRRKTTEKKEEESFIKNHLPTTKVNNNSSSSLIMDKIRNKQKEKSNRDNNKNDDDKEEEEEGVVIRSSRKLDLHATSSSTRTSANNNIVRLDSIQESVADNNNNDEEATLDAKIRAKMIQGSSRRQKKKKETKDEEKVDENDNDNENARNNSKISDCGISSGIPIIPHTPPTTTRVLKGEDVRAKIKQQKKLKRKLTITDEERIDPLRAAEEQRKANAKPLNPKFADLHETGQWGRITKLEKFALFLLIIGAITAAIVLGYKFGHIPKTSAPTIAPTKLRPRPPTNPPTMSPTGIDFRTEFGFEVLRNTSNKLSLPTTVDDLIGAKANPESTPQMLAAEYVLFDDPLVLDVRDARFLERYALIVFYYQNGGCAGHWLSSTNWMTNTDHCDGKWYGIVCDLTNHVIEIQLSKNYITGRIPIELQNLVSLIALDLSNNALTGVVPYEAVSTNTTYTIQLNNNLLSGEFPFEEVRSRSPILGNLWIQENTDLKGTITEDYCILDSITLDCDNYSPQPVYPAVPYVPPGAISADISITTFQQNCYEQGLAPPREYTCNFDEPVPLTKSPVSVPSTAASVDICGVPSPV